MLYIDFETRSKADLKKVGTVAYATDPSTEIICMGWRIGDEKGVMYRGAKQMPAQVMQALKNGNFIVAWNAQFDRLIWENCIAPEYSGTDLPLARWYCSAAQMRVNALPAALADASKAVFGTNNKDFRGPQLIRTLSIPRDDGTFNEDPALTKEMGEYCAQDVDLMYDLVNSTRRMSQDEHKHYINNEVVNDYGIRVNRNLAKHAVSYATAETAELGKHLHDLTGGHITKHTQVARIKDWVLKHSDKTTHKLMTVYKKDEKKISLDKAVRQRVLAADDDHAITLKPQVREVIEMVDMANKSSVAKFQKMLDMNVTEPDGTGRVKGAFVYAGASQTQRYASRGLQLHNFPRDCLDDDDHIELLRAMQNDDHIDNILFKLSRSLRSAIIPGAGCRLVVGDWSQIEARALPWLANTKNAEKRLDVFRECDADPDAVDLYTRTSNDLGLGDRQLGKVTELSLGYGGGKGALMHMANVYGIHMAAPLATTIVDKWRAANGWAVGFWGGLEQAAKTAIANPGKSAIVGRVTYNFYPDLIGGTLVASLPGGINIQYPRAKLETQQTKFGERTAITALKANWTPAAGEKEWPRVTLWRGLLAENVTQALCGGILRYAVDECLYNDLPVVGHVHDEIILDVPIIEAEEVSGLLKEIMEDTPSWLTGLPLAAEPTTMTRYGK